MIELRGRFLQYAAALTVSILGCSNGIAIMWASPVLPQLTVDTSPIGVKITPNEASLIASSLLMGSVVGNMLLGPSIDYFGRRGLLLLVSVPVCVCWIMIMLARSVAVLYAARFFVGLFLSTTTSVSVMYIGETSESAIRGRVSFMCVIILETSNVATIILGAFISYRDLALIGALLPLIFLAIFYYMPESPYFYTKIGDFEKAKASLTKFRKHSDVDEELKEMQANVKKNTSSRSSIIDLFFVPKYRKNFLIIIGLKTLHQLSGTSAVQSYMNMIFSQANTGLDADTSSMISISVSVPSLFLSYYLVDNFGRKPVYYLSTLGVILSLVFECFYFYMQEKGQNVESISWLPVTGIFLYFMFRTMGIAHLPFILVGELLAPNIKAAAMSISLVFGSLLASLVSYGFPHFSAAFGMGSSFLFFAVSTFCGFLFVLVFLPETKGKTLADIQTTNS